MMNKRSIYLKSVSCKGIKSPVPFQTPSVYATVSLSTTSQRHQTPVDTANGENPEWECPMLFDLATLPSDAQDLFLEFNLMAGVPLLGNRLVGTAHVPVSDLIDGGSRGHVGYQVLWPDGKPNGTIQLWYQMEGSQLPQDMTYSSSEPSASASPAADFSYKPTVEPGQVYPVTVPVTVPFNTGPVCYPPMPGLVPYNSEPHNPGSVEPGRVYGTPAGTEYMLYPPPNSGQYPPPNMGFGSLVPCYPPPPQSNNPLMNQAVSVPTYYRPPGNYGESGSMYYPPPGTRYPPANHGESGSTYYPSPGTTYPPVVGSDCCDIKYREAQEPVVAYPVGNGYYPPPPKYPYC